MSTPAKKPAELRLTEIDGIRGILSIIVVLGHTAVALKVDAFAGMQGWYWMPMDVFFAISGFLVGRICIGNTGRPGFLRSYLVRRVLRIWPAYYSVVLTVSIVGFFTLSDWPALALIKQLTFLQFTEYLFFAPRGEYLYGLLHTWSVAVEEHFYLALPLLAALLARRSPWQIVLLLLAMAALSVWLRLFENMNAWVILTRLHSFAMGLGVAYLTYWSATSDFWAGLLRSRLLITAVVALSLLWLFLSPVLPYEQVAGVYGTQLRWVSKSVAAAFFASVLLAAIYHTNLNNGSGIGILRNKFLAHLGEISYSTYLWHWPLFVALKPLNLADDYGQFTVAAAMLLLVFAIANASYYGIEKPFLRFKHLWAYDKGRKK